MVRVPLAQSGQRGGARANGTRAGLLGQWFWAEGSVRAPPLPPPPPPPALPEPLCPAPAPESS